MAGSVAFRFFFGCHGDGFGTVSRRPRIELQWSRGLLNVFKSVGIAPPIPPTVPVTLGEPGAEQRAVIKVLSGAASGREVALMKVVTTIGKPGVAVASISRGPRGFLLAHVEGERRPLLNGQAIPGEPATLKNGDVLELAGTRMQFIEA